MNFPSIVTKPEHFPDALKSTQQQGVFQGILAISYVLKPEFLLASYRKGIFPWPDPSLNIIPWFSPDPRMILRPSEFHPSHSLRKRLKKAGLGRYRKPDSEEDSKIEVYLDRSPVEVMRACADTSAENRNATWISEEIIGAYSQLIASDNLHSLEVYVDGELAGGLYGLSIGRMFYGESMFHRLPDTSKIAAAALVHICRFFNIDMIDCQQETAYLSSLGGYAIPLRTYIDHLTEAVNEPAPDWNVFRGKDLSGLLRQKVQFSCKFAL